MGIVNNEWLERQIQKEWENPECRELYIEATIELDNETGLDTLNEIAELDEKLGVIQ